MKDSTHGHARIGFGYVNDSRIELFSLIVCIADNDACKRGAYQHDPGLPHFRAERSLVQSNAFRVSQTEKSLTLAYRTENLIGSHVSDDPVPPRTTICTIQTCTRMRDVCARAQAHNAASVLTWR